MSRQARMVLVIVVAVSMYWIGILQGRSERFTTDVIVQKPNITPQLLIPCGKSGIEEYQRVCRARMKSI